MNRAWVVNDLLRAAEFAALSTFALVITPYKPTRYKVLIAAIFGYSIADLCVCISCYVFHFGGWFFANSFQLLSFLFFSIRFWKNSFSIPSDMPEIEHVYCLRLIPNSIQSLIINIFLSHSYAIYCNGNMYYFNKGYLVKRHFTKELLKKYHAIKGGKITDNAILELDDMIGLKWSIFGNNCIMSLGKFWRNHA